jgi:hypothetical protein
MKVNAQAGSNFHSPPKGNPRLHIRKLCGKQQSLLVWEAAYRQPERSEAKMVAKRTLSPSCLAETSGPLLL